MRLKKWLQFPLRLIKDTAGGTVIEYVVVAAAIAMVIVISVKALGVNVSCMFSNVMSAVTGSAYLPACAGNPGGET